MKKNMRFRVLIRRLAENENFWFGTIRPDYDYFNYKNIDFNSYEGKFYTFCYDSVVMKSKTAVRDWARIVCKSNNIKISKYFIDE